MQDQSDAATWPRAVTWASPNRKIEPHKTHLTIDSEPEAFKGPTKER